jgi:hypothetical protein
MARKKTKARKVSAGRARVSDEELVARLQERSEGREVLGAKLPEAIFDSVVEGLLKEFPLPKELPHFYCRKCGEYHLKTHPHYASTPASKKEEQ